MSQENICQTFALLDETLETVAYSRHPEDPRVIDKMDTAITKGDFVHLAREAHNLKSAVGTMGLEQAQELCQALEDIGNSQQIQAGASTLAQLSAKLQEITPALRQLKP